MLLMCLPVFLAACSNDDDPTPDPEPQKPVICPVEDGDEAGRTVLVYMVARNSLGTYDFDTADIEEMQRAAKSGCFGSNRLLLFHSPQNGVPALKEVTASGIETLKSYTSSFSAVESASMKTVIADCREFAPAAHYGIVLWSHASGWLEHGIDESSPKRAFGEDRGRSMNVTTLARVLEGENFDFVYFDCCFMGGVEVFYELRDVTPVVVASVSELPADGMPYDLTLPHLMQDEADVAGAAQATFNSYDALTGNARTCTMSVIDTSALTELAEAVRKLFAMHPVLTSTAGIQQYVSSRDSYYGDFYDLDNYLEALAQAAGTPEASAAYTAASQAIDNCVIYRAATPWLWQRDAYNSAAYEVKINRHCGMTAYILRSAQGAATNNYSNLKWWNDVVSTLF